MKILFLVLFGLSFISSLAHTAQAQGNPIAPCLSDEAATMIWTADNEQPLRYFNVDELMTIEGVQVEWLGYAGDSAYQNELEMQGVVAGFKGINLHRVSPVGVFILERDYNDPVSRVVITRYNVTGQYIFSVTTLNQFDAQGSRLDYHIIGHPAGGACIWLVDPETILDFMENLQ